MPRNDNNIVKKNPCPVCSGTRVIEDTKGRKYVCGECNGTGQKLPPVLQPKKPQPQEKKPKK